MARKKTFVVVVLLLVIGLSAFAQSYEVIFYAEGNEIWAERGFLQNIGHAFVYVSGYGTYGFYPENAKSFSDVMGSQGILKDDSARRNRYDAMYLISVDTATRNRITNFIDR